MRSIPHEGGRLFMLVAGHDLAHRQYLRWCSDDRWYGFGLHEPSKFRLLEKMLVPVEKLMDDLRKHRDMISYLKAGSFVK